MLINFINAERQYIELEDVKCCIVTDECGCKILVMETGDVYRYTEDEDGYHEVKPFMRSELSKKADGYLVAVFNYIDEKGKVKQYRIKQHILVAFCFKNKEYNIVKDMLCDNPVVNHKNNCPWDNNISNLEWVSISLNNRHGRMCKSLRVHLEEYTYLKRNMSDTIFTVLIRPISAYKLWEFSMYEGVDLKITQDSEGTYKGCYSEEVTNSFVKWLFDSKVW